MSTVVVQVPGGVLCILGGAGLLWWNEGYAYGKTRIIRAIRDKVLSVDGSKHPTVARCWLMCATGLLPENEGEVVHYTGELRTKEVGAPHPPRAVRFLIGAPWQLVQDPEFILDPPPECQPSTVADEHCSRLSLTREVETYQWVRCACALCVEQWF